MDDQGKHFVTGINASSSKVESGENRHCRLFSYANDQQVLRRLKRLSQC